MRVYDFTQYNGGASSSVEPSRKSTPQELAEWMNKMAASVSSAVIHWVTEGEIHFARLDADSRAILEMGIL